MENALLIAKIAGITYLAIGLGILINPSNMKKLLDDFLKSPGLTFFSAWMTTVLGLLIIFSYNVWTRHRGLAVTLLGWIATLKGISLFLLPNTLLKISANMVEKKLFIVITSFILGILFLYIGFFA